MISGGLDRLIAEHYKSFLAWLNRLFPSRQQELDELDRLIAEHKRRLKELGVKF